MDQHDIAVAKLGSTCELPSFMMKVHAGRDLVASILQHRGWENFEPPFPKILVNCLKVWPGLFVDVGANTGFYSFLALAVDRSIRVVAFEPDTDVLPLLKGNIILNNMAERIVIHSCALSDGSGQASLYIPSAEHGLVESSSSLEATFKETHAEVRSIEKRLMDDFFAMSAEAPTVVKIDVEGHEVAVLRGGVQTIKHHRPVIFVELLDRADFDFLNHFLDDNQYSDVPLFFDKPLSVSKEVKFHDMAWNHAFVPNEKVGSFLAVT